MPCVNVRELLFHSLDDLFDPFEQHGHFQSPLFWIPCVLPCNGNGLLGGANQLLGMYVVTSFKMVFRQPAELRRHAQFGIAGLNQHLFASRYGTLLSRQLPGKR